MIRFYIDGTAGQKDGTEYINKSYHSYRAFPVG